MSLTSSIPLLKLGGKGHSPPPSELSSTKTASQFTTTVGDEPLPSTRRSSCEQHAQNSDLGASHLLDRGIWSRNICVAGLVLSWISGFVAVIVGAWLVHFHGSGHLTLAEGAAEGVKLVINVYITLLNEAMGFIHTISLKWALHHERRLEFNSDLRLLSSSRQSLPNRWRVAFRTL